MEYLIGAIAGLIYGGIVAFLKGRFLWKRSLESDMQKKKKGSFLKKAASVLALALIFFLRGVLPFHWAAALIAAAVAVSVIQPYMISRYKPKETAEE